MEINRLAEQIAKEKNQRVQVQTFFYPLQFVKYTIFDAIKNQLIIVQKTEVFFRLQFTLILTNIFL